MLLAFGLLAEWQRREYVHESELVRETVARQADSVMHALIGGMQSHRRMGRFFYDQIQRTLDELVRSHDVLAVVVVSEDGSQLLSAGELDLAGEFPQAGRSWGTLGFCSVERFELEPDRGEGPYGDGTGGNQASGNRAGGGHNGLGRGLGPLKGRDEVSPFSQGGQFAAVLLLDRVGADSHCRRAARTRGFVVVFGELLLICLAFAWHTSVRLVETRSRATMLESEARHLRELGQAAAGLAHETRNPLGLIRGWTQRLTESEFSTPKQQQQVQAVLEECDRVTARINQFLAYARPCEPKFEPIDLGELLTELATLLEPDLDEKGLSLNLIGVEPSQTVRADREMFRQALFNLLQNAIQFSPEGGTVEIGVRGQQHTGFRVEIADQGPGVAAKSAESLFTPYFTTRSDGTGLGLAIVHRLAAAHDWQAGYTPRDTGGAVFWLNGLQD